MGIHNAGPKGACERLGVEVLTWPGISRPVLASELINPTTASRFASPVEYQRPGAAPHLGRATVVGQLQLALRMFEHCDQRFFAAPEVASYNFVKKHLPIRQAYPKVVLLA